jgi:hypothetical protein
VHKLAHLLCSLRAGRFSARSVTFGVSLGAGGFGMELWGTAFSRNMVF